MCRFSRKLNERGYTLIESMFQLMIFAAFVQLIVLFFIWKSPIVENYSRLSHIEWEMFVVDLQKDLEDIYEIEVNAMDKGILFLNQRGKISIEQNNKVIRKTVDGLGHIPLLTKVTSATFTHKGTVVVVDVVLTDGTRKERDFAIGLYPK